MADIILKPSKLLLVMAVMIIGGSLFVISAFIASCIAEPNPFAIIVGVFFMPPLVVVAILQYFAAFRAVRIAAMITSIMLYLFGAFATFAFITTAGELAVERIPFSYAYTLLGTMAMIAAAFFVCGRVNANWSRRLRTARETLAIVPGQGEFGAREFLLGVVVIAAMGATASYLVYTEPPGYAEHVDRFPARLGLPSGATDVSYCKGFRGTIAYEFTIDEKEFCEWVESGIGSIESESAGIPLKEIVEPSTITRYNAYSNELNGPEKIEVFNGLHYSWSKEDRGVYAVFDRATGRAYYHAHYH